MAFFKQRTGTDVEGDIRTAIDGMRPLLRIETMDIELVAFEMENSVAVIRCTGDCPDCDLSAENLTVGIEAHLRHQVPEIRAVRFVTR